MLSWITGSSLAAPTQDLPVSLPKEAPLPPLPVAPTLPPSDPLPAPVQPSQRPSTRKEVNPNAPYVILACAGTAVGVGVLIGLRQVRQLRRNTVALSEAAAAAEAAEQAGSSTSSRPVAQTPIALGAQSGRTKSILSNGSLQGIKTTLSQLPSTSPFKIKSTAAEGIASAPVSAATQSLLRKPSATSSNVTSAPVFPPSSSRTPAPPNPSSTPSVSIPPAPKATLRSLIREGRKQDSEEHEDLPPMTTSMVLRATAAFAAATGLAVVLVGGPFGAICWWLGVEEAADFTPMFRRKIISFFPSLEEDLLRAEAAEVDASSSSSSGSSMADYLPSFLKWTPSSSASDEPAGPSSYIPSILHQGASPEGEEESSVYSWFEGVRDEFEKDRLEEVKRRKEDEAFYKEWEEKMRREGR